MRPRLLFLSAFFGAAMLLSQTAGANTFPIFAQGGKQATVVIQGSPSDLDAQRLFDLLVVPAQEEQGKLTKKVKFIGADGIDAFSIVCAFSKVIPGNGSCIVVMKQAVGLTIDGTNRSFVYELSSQDAAGFAALFHTTVAQPAYLSNAGHLELDILRPDDGLIASDDRVGIKTLWAYH
jgi:hypothetical protein